MELQQLGNQPANDVQTDRLPSVGPEIGSLIPQQGGQSCSTCGGSTKPDANNVGPAGFVYAIGHIQPRFPSLALEKEYAQAVGHSHTTGLTDRQTLHTVLSQRQHRYLVRGLCWVFTVEGLDTYILMPRDPGDFDTLIDTLRYNPHATDIDVVVGVRGPIATPDMCNGLQVPIVFFDQIYWFDTDALVKAIPRPEAIDEDAFGPMASELLTRIIQVADNSGSPDENRALNYLAMRYPAIYAQAADSFARNFALAGVETRPSRLSGARRILDVIFTFRNRSTDVAEMYFTRVDVTEEFPFLVTKLSLYFDR